MSSSYVHSLIHRWSANEGQSKGSRERMCVATVNCQKHCGLSLRLRGHFLSETCICAVGHVNRTVTKDQSSAPLPTNFQALSAITICRTMQLDRTLLKPCLLLVCTLSEQQQQFRYITSSSKSAWATRDYVVGALS